SWSDCPVPLTAVINREIDEHDQHKDWVLVSTAANLTANRMRSRAFSLVANQALFVLLAYTLLQAHLRLRQRQRLNPLTRTSILDLLTPTLEVVAVYYQQRFCLLSLPEFARILLTLEEKARHKLRKKMRRFEKNLDGLLNNARPP
ncbi:MAG: hypothetical protein GY953_00450, partial [bacterium]|nr:hypothetical protein [bacterium]